MTTTRELTNKHINALFSKYGRPDTGKSAEDKKVLACFAMKINTVHNFWLITRAEKDKNNKDYLLSAYHTFDGRFWEFRDNIRFSELKKYPQLVRVTHIRADYVKNYMDKIQKELSK